MTDSPINIRSIQPPQHRQAQEVFVGLPDADKTFVELLGKEPAHRYRWIMDSAALAIVEELDV